MSKRFVQKGHSGVASALKTKCYGRNKWALERGKRVHKEIENYVKHNMEPKSSYSFTILRALDSLGIRPHTAEAFVSANRASKKDTWADLVCFARGSDFHVVEVKTNGWSKCKVEATCNTVDEKDKVKDKNGNDNSKFMSKHLGRKVDNTYYYRCKEQLANTMAMLAYTYKIAPGTTLTGTVLVVCGDDGWISWPESFTYDPKAGINDPTMCGKQPTARKRKCEKNAPLVSKRARRQPKSAS